MSVVDPDHEWAALAALEARLEAEDGSAAAAAKDEPLAPVAAEARKRLLAAVSHAGRFERFVSRVAEMADVAEAQARAWLDAVWGETPLWEPAAPGVVAWWVEGGPRVANALRGFVRVSAGGGFPHHEHLGEERVLILQGGAVLSTGERLYADDLCITPGGEAHALRAVGPGPDLLVFTVVREGLRVGGVPVRPRS